MVKRPITNDERRGPRDPALASHRLRVGVLGVAVIAALTTGFPAMADDAVAAAATATAATAATASPATTTAAETCSQGVIVVIDFTDLGGKLEARCAEGNPATGRDALSAAGFTTTDSQPGFLCAIDSRPDPCPEVFDGSFWSYWHSTRDGEWTSYQVGADSSNPLPGEIEGWRYNDGTTPPGIAPAEAASLVPTTPAETATPGAADPDSTESGTEEAATSTQAEREAERSGQDAVLAIVTVGFLALVVALAIVFVLRARSRGAGTGR